ncbi:HbrB-like-domain-containing protein [Amanita rubescens]|nr:HbrB-like-domain-containing protein [Amanita rubescens]
MSSELDEAHRRSSSDATPRPTPAIQDTGGVPDSSSRRLGFLTDKLSSSALLHPHRTDSTVQTPNSSSMTSSTPKSHVSPAKTSYNRTYDSKLVTREMHRLGVSSPLAPSISSAPSTSSLALPAPSIVAPTMSQSSSTDPWRSLHVHVLPLFNGEPLRIPIEDLNTLVKRHIQAVVSSSPPRALVTLEQDTSELIASGMVTLNAKLMEIEDEKLVARIVEIWGFFWDNVLTYVEGVLLPLQTDPLLSSLYRPPKAHHRATSPSRQNTAQTMFSSSISNVSPTHIDVRSIALRSFRDKVILPLFERLYARLALPNRQDNVLESAAHHQPRLQQMLLVLSAQSTYRPTAHSLATATSQPSPGEAAIADLLRSSAQPWLDVGRQTRTPSFLSGGLPRDRRGRIAQKRKSKKMTLSSLDDESLEETPRLGNTFSTVLFLEREREREILESLRSPDINARASMGGWGLGEGGEEAGRTGEEEEEDGLDWDQAQAMVERMIGITPDNRALHP